jgi:hypothetical protein
MLQLYRNIIQNLNHPQHGWKSTHFWGPMANWGLVVAAVYDASFKGAETIDIPMTATLIGYSTIFMGFAWQVQPRNYLLFACHSFNVCAQWNQMRRAINYGILKKENGKEEFNKLCVKFGCFVAGITGIIKSKNIISSAILNSPVPNLIKKFVSHPAGPMTIFFWAANYKWLLSVNNLADLNKPTEKISLPQQTALTLTGFIWARYSVVIIPVNYNLSFVNFVLGASSGYHLIRKIKAEYFK